MKKTPWIVNYAAEKTLCFRSTRSVLFSFQNDEFTSKWVFYCRQELYLVVEDNIHVVVAADSGMAVLAVAVVAVGLAAVESALVFANFRE